MKTFATKTTIRATPDAIWGLLTDGSAYPSWNETVTKVDGKIAFGEKVTIHAKISPGRAFPVKLTELVQNQKMVWTARMPLGLFQGQRTYTLTPASDGTVEFSMVEIFSGPLSPMIEKQVPKELQGDFEKFAACLKKRAEEGK